MSANLSGVWDADLARCRLLTAAPAGIRVTISQSGEDLSEELVVTAANGVAQSIVFACVTDGSDDTCRINGKPVRGNAQWQDDELVIETGFRLVNGRCTSAITGRCRRMGTR
jgi:hypothetical protein